MAIELTIKVQDDGSVVVKRFKDTTVQSMKDASRATDEAGKKTEDFGKKHKSSIGSAIDDVKKLKSQYLAMAGAVATFTAIGYSVLNLANKTANYVETVTDLSDATAISTRTIQVMGKAAELSGETFQDAQSAINMFFRQLRAAKSGSDEAALTFRNLGVELGNANDGWRTNEEVLMDVARQLTLITDENDRAAYMQELFARSGIKMSETLQRLGGDYGEIANMLDRYNLLIDDEKRAKVEAYLKATREFKTALDGLAQTLGEKLLPPLTWMVKNAGAIVGVFAPMAPALFARGASEKAILDIPMAAGVRTPKPFGTGAGEKKTGGGRGKTEAEAEAAWWKEVTSLDKKSADYRKDVETKRIEFQKKLDKEDQELHERTLKRSDEAIETAEKEEAAILELNRSKEDSYMMMAGAVASVLELMAGQSKEWLAVYKFGASVEATISAILSGQRAFEDVLSSPASKLLGPLALPAAIAARVAAYAEGMAQVAAINAQSFQRGGVLLTGPRAFGTDERWYKGKPGEGVLTEQGVRNVGGVEGLERINRGRGVAGNVSIVVNADRFDERFVAERLVPMMRRQTRKRS